MTGLAQTHSKAAAPEFPVLKLPNEHALQVVDGAQVGGNESLQETVSLATVA